MSESPRYKIFLAQPSAGAIKPQVANSVGCATNGLHDVRVLFSQFGDVCAQLQYVLVCCSE